MGRLAEAIGEAVKILEVTDIPEELAGLLTLSQADVIALPPIGSTLLANRVLDLDDANILYIIQYERMSLTAEITDLRLLAEQYLFNNLVLQLREQGMI